MFEIFIFDSLSVNVEKCRLLVFVLADETERFIALRARILWQREARMRLSWIVYSDSECGLLLPIQIMDSCMLNVTSNETLASQNSIWVVKDGMMG